MTDPLLRIVVHGTPGTAGSKDAFPLWRTLPDGSKQFVRTLQVEQDINKVKSNWRMQVMAAAERFITKDGRIVAPYPLDEPVAASLVFTIAKPASAPIRRRTWPAAKPDLSKAARAFEDALQAAGVLKNDARIVEYTRLAKVFPREDPDALDVPGAVIQLWRMTDLVDWQRDAIAAQPAGTLFDS